MHLHSLGAKTPSWPCRGLLPCKSNGAGRSAISKFPERFPGGLLFCTDRYIIPLTREVQANICIDHYRYPGFPMTHLDLAQAQHFVRQQANWPAKKLRRQLMGAA